MTVSNQDLVESFDYLCVAREKLFGWVRGLPVNTYTQSFPVGLGTISATLTHIARAQWTFTQRLTGRDDDLSDNPFRMDKPPSFDRLVPMWAEINPETRRVLSDFDRDRRIEMVPTLVKPPVKLRLSASIVARQVLLHEVHHRAQVMSMLRHAGVQAENLDYPLLMAEITPL